MSEQADMVQLREQAMRSLLEAVLGAAATGNAAQALALAQAFDTLRGSLPNSSPRRVR